MRPAFANTEALGVYARHLAAVMDARTAELGKRVAQDQPEWATKHLGPVPVPGTSDYEAWVERAAVVEAYREQYVEDGPADVANPIGRAPSRTRNPQAHADWQRANDALGIVAQASKDIATMSDAELYAVAQRWSDVVAMAPPYVKPLLDEAHAEHRRLANRYDRQVAELGKDREPGRRLRELGLSVQKAAEQLDTYLRSHAERGRWYDDTADLRQEAQDARAELARRFPDEPPVVIDVRESMKERQAEAYDRRIVSEHRSQERAAEREASRSAGHSARL